ncbi:hypothetical protein GCM10017643_43850 [Ancylobacter dichloromethanicus]|uniref:Uncharacterized protein n=1 Tax=Ancylobacter dichloromethanicus TaxID=518825 RepID=A0A9W6JBL8_9HYPH|nr:hypothetical protein GCM10017643_43850 [Ancylobacter dichloromethanicus]
MPGEPKRNTTPTHTRQTGPPPASELARPLSEATVRQHGVDCNVDLVAEASEAAQRVISSARLVSLTPFVM